MTAIYILLVIIILGALSGLVIYKTRFLNRDKDNNVDTVLERLTEAAKHGVYISLEEIELQQSFFDRIILPFIVNIGEFAERFTPLKKLQETSLKLELAGHPGRIDAATFLAIRFLFLLVAFLGSGLYAIFYYSKTNWTTATVFFIVVFFTLVGFFIPKLWLQSKINARQNEIQKALPDALDLLIICMEAGYGFEVALSKVSEKWENELSVAFGRYIREIQLGKPQSEALRDMSDRIGLPEFTSFVAIVIQGLSVGVNLSRTLRIQSDNLYAERKERILNQLSSIDNLNQALFFILIGPIFILWFTWPMLAQILAASPK